MPCPWIAILLVIATVGRVPAVDQEAIDRLNSRVAALEAENAALRAQRIPYRTFADLNGTLLLDLGPPGRGGLPRNLLTFLNLGEDRLAALESAVEDARRAQATLIAAQSPHAEDDGNAIRLVIHDLGPQGADIRRILLAQVEEILGPDRVAALRCIQRTGLQDDSIGWLGVFERGDTAYVFVRNGHGAFNLQQLFQPLAVGGGKEVAQQRYNGPLSKDRLTALLALKPYLPREILESEKDDAAAATPIRGN